MTSAGGSETPEKRDLKKALSAVGGGKLDPKTKKASKDEGRKDGKRLLLRIRNKG